MSPTSNPIRTSPDLRPPCNTTLMTAQSSSLLRRTRPSQVQTSQHGNTQPNSIPLSATSASTATSSFQYDSPVISPDHAVITASSSVQPSPDPCRGRDAEQFPPLQIGPPLLSHRPSFNSVNQSMAASSGAMADAVSSGTGTSGMGLMRRLSNRASKFARTRRQSSAAPKSRDGSIGPGVIRRRSDSTNTAPGIDHSLLTDSDDEIHDEAQELNRAFGVESTARDFLSASPAMSVSDPASAAEAIGPKVPYTLTKGTPLIKVSKKKKKKPKRCTFLIETDSGKIILDKGRGSKNYIYIDDIKEVRRGSDIRQYRVDYGIAATEEARFFTIHYVAPDKSKSKMMHLIAESDETFSHWVTALDSIAKHRADHMASLMAFNESAIREFWTKHFEKTRSAVEEERMDLRGVERVCLDLHIHLAHKDLLARFAAADVTGAGLNYAEFQVFVSEMKKREDIRSLYQDLASNPERGITFPEFMTFLRETQCEDVDANPKLWETRFTRYSLRDKSKDVPCQRTDLYSIVMNEQALTSYLISKDNDHLVHAPSEYTLDRPFNEYFISSSHNTYLVGRQVADISSLEGYISTLVRGCRSVEIDCWDGSDGQPVVKHGYAMTNSISFREVVIAINKYAFITSRFPLWVSLEVHCNSSQQEIMANTMKEIFGPRLVTEPLDSSSDKLPSPTELKDRILIKVKGTHQSHEQRSSTESSSRRRGNSSNSVSSLTSPFSKPIAAEAASIPTQHLATSPRLSPNQNPKRIGSKRVDTITEGEVHDTVSSSTSDCDSEDEKPGKRQTSKIVKALGELGVYCSGVKFDGFESAECKKSNHILSFMEGTFRKHSKSSESKLALARHNMRYMMRVYPQYSRVSSDNFNPLMYWRKGVQMTALNWQTFDLGMQLNQAMFDGGIDRSGYVLKPESMREFRILPSPLPEEVKGKFERYNLAFNIDVISAQQLMRPAVLQSYRTLDPFVEVEVFHANDKRDKHDSMGKIPILTDTPLKSSTRVVKENGFNPVFNHRGPFNVTTKYPELVFVKFTVKLSSSDSETVNGRGLTVASFTAKLSSLKQGYRTLPLLDPNGDQYLFSTLFCRIKIEPATSVYVPNPGASSTESVGKLRNISRNVFSRSSNSPKSSFEKYSTNGSHGDSSDHLTS